MFCKKCGKELPDTAKFCPACGTKAGGSGAAMNPMQEWNAAEQKNRLQKPVVKTGKGKKKVLISAGITVAAVLLLVLLVVAGAEVLFKDKRYAKRMEAYIEYCEDIKNQTKYAGYQVGGTIALDKKGMPVMWLFLVEDTDPEHPYRFTAVNNKVNGCVQYLTYERGQVALMDEIKVRNLTLRPVPSTQGAGLNGGDCVIIYDEKGKQIRRIECIGDKDYTGDELKDYLDVLTSYYEICSPYKPIFYFSSNGSELTYVGKSIEAGREWKDRWIPKGVLKTDNAGSKITEAYKNNGKIKKFLKSMWMCDANDNYILSGIAVFDAKGGRIGQTDSMRVNADFFFGKLQDGETYLRTNKIHFLSRTDFVEYMQRLEEKPAYTPQDIYAAWMQQSGENYE